MIDDNIVLPYRIDTLTAHGRVVRLGSVIDEIIKSHHYPEPVSRLLGEAIVLAVLVGSSLKFEGRFVLQTKTKGPVSLLIIDLKTNGAIRGYATLNTERYHLLGKNPSQRAMLGKGHIAFTVDQGENMENYQGIVPLDKDLHTAAHLYFAQSEQIKTTLKLVAQPNADNIWRAGGIMIQQTAQNLDQPTQTMATDDWYRLTALLETLHDDELLDEHLSASHLAYRLYHEDGVRIFNPIPIHFSCPCSRERITTFLQGLDSDDINAMQKEGQIQVDCQFCNTRYHFDSQSYITSIG